MSELAAHTLKRYFKDWKEGLNSFSAPTAASVNTVLKVAPHEDDRIEYINQNQLGLYWKCWSTNRDADHWVVRVGSNKSLGLRILKGAGREQGLDISHEFEKNLNLWKEETKLYSSLHQIILHKSYQRIIGLGPTVLPLIFREYEANGGQWHSALEALTGVNPITEDCIGRPSKIKNAWMNWAIQNNFL